MSERSFRDKSPEEVARERMGQAGEATPEKPKRRGSFSLPLSLRSNSQQKKDKGSALGVIQPLSGQPGAFSLTPPSPKKIKASIKQGRSPRGDARPTGITAKTDREILGGGARSMSVPTHSAMKLPHPPGIGSSASSIRSFQTDLSSIAEDSAFDGVHLPLKAPQAYLYPIKSAMKGGSGPPSIISEALSEESKSSLGVPDSKRTKARVSFSDEQKKQAEANRVIMHNGNVAEANFTATRNASATNQGNGGKDDGYLNPVAVTVGTAGGAAIGVTALARSVSAPASPPISPPVSPQVPSVVPAEMTPKVLPVVAVTSMPTPPQTQSTVPSQSPVVPTDTPPVVINSPTIEPSEAIPVAEELPKPTTPTQTTPLKPTGNSTTMPVTIHVFPARTLPQKQTRLPGAFPDPTPDPTPPSTAESALTVHDAQGMSDAVSPLPPSPRPQSPRFVNDLNEIDLQRGLSMETMALVPDAAASPTSEVMVRGPSIESVDSRTSTYSDAMDVGPPPDVRQEAIIATVPVATAATSTAAPKTASTQALQPTPPTKKPKVNGESSKIAPVAIATGAAAISSAAGYLVATHQLSPTAPKRPSSSNSPPKTPTTPRAPGSVRNVRTSLRENGPSTLSAPRTTLRSSSVPPLSSPPHEKKVFRRSMRDAAHTDEATEYARGLMALPALERIPSDSSFKRLRPRESSTIRMTLRDPKPEEPPPLRRRDSDSSSEVRIGYYKHSTSIFGRFKRKDSFIDQPPVAARVAAGSRFEDSDDDDDIDHPPPSRGIGGAYEDTESLPSPRLRKRSSFSTFFRGGRMSRVGSDVSNTGAPGASATDPTTLHRRVSSSDDVDKIVSKRTGKEKRFPGLRKLFRIKE
jgi:hypothetical protein